MRLKSRAVVNLFPGGLSGGKEIIGQGGKEGITGAGLVPAAGASGSLAPFFTPLARPVGWNLVEEEGAFGVGHEGRDVSAGIADAGDIGVGAVGINRKFGVNLSLGAAVTPEDEVLFVEGTQDIGILADKAAFAVGESHGEYLILVQFAGERRP